LKTSVIGSKASLIGNKTSHLDACPSMEECPSSRAHIVEYWEHFTNVGACHKSSSVILHLPFDVF